MERNKTDRNTLEVHKEMYERRLERLKMRGGKSFREILNDPIHLRARRPHCK